MEFDHDGKMYNIETNKVSLCVTPNHRMYVGNCHHENYRLEYAENIYGKMRCYKNNVEIWEPEVKMDKFVLPGVTYTTYGKKEVTLPDLELDLEAWCTFFGIWMAEGSTNKDRFVSIAANKPRVQEALELINQKLNFEIRKYLDRKERTAWTIMDKRLINYLEPLSVGAVNKYLPEWCFNLDIHHTRTLIEGMLLGDGHTMKNVTTRRYDTSSKRLADDFQRLCLHAGWAASMSLKYSKGHVAKGITNKDGVTKPIVQTADSWRLTVITVQNRPLVNRNIKKGEQQDFWTDYNGKVFCCTVPSGIMYIRKNGNPIWCGNSSRSGQKCTCGILIRKEDMPFTESGIVPDLIINPNCIPSRMTIGQLLETVLAKSGAIKGEFKDGTPFEERNIEEICQELEDLGFNRYGYETMYSGVSGQKFKSLMFIGPTFYQRLKHMVADKIHARATGPTVMLTRQPPEGRTKNGGLRFGEMERDVGIAHGMGVFLKERMVECSDAYECHVCDQCGMIVGYMKGTNSYYCNACDNHTNISKIAIPYCFKLMIQELMSINIFPRIETENSITNES